jgi:hypothetical protein
VILVPDPVVVTPPGVRVSVHDPVEGKPLNNTLPVDTVHVGGVMVPTTGAVGADGGAVIITFDDDPDIQLFALVTVKVNVPTGRPEMVVVVHVPVVVTPPGVRVSVHVPVAGNPLNTTLPVGTEHVGTVTVPTPGTAGLAFTVSV